MSVAILAQDITVMVKHGLPTSDDEPPKRIRVLELGGGKYVSFSVREAILKDLKELGCIPPDLAISRRRMQAARKETAQRDTPYGRLLTTRTFTTTEGAVDFPVQNPLAMLYVAMADGPRFARYVRTAIQDQGAPTPQAPWSIIFYIDEVTCGNPLAVRGDAKRKVQGVYWTIYHLGDAAMCDESCWFEIIAFRSSEVVEFVGGCSHLLDVCMSCFFDPNGHDVRYSLPFDLMGYGSFRLSLEVEMLIADIKALTECIGANGVSAIMPCFFCRQILSFKAKAKPEMAGLNKFVDLGCLDTTKWGKHTNASLLTLLEGLKVAHATLSNPELKKKQTLCGFKHVPGNFFA